MKAIDRLEIGDEAPELSLPATGLTAGHGQPQASITLSGFRGEKHVVLAFFPGAFTPVCSAQIPGYEDDLPELERLGAQLLAISTDSVAVLEAWAKSHGGLSFPLLSDFWPHGATALRYNSLRSSGVSERSIFVVDRHGRIAYIDIHDVRKRPPTAPIFDVLAKLR